VPQNINRVASHDANFLLRRDNALRDAHTVVDALLDANSRDDIIDYIVERHAARPIVLDFDGLHVLTREQHTIAGQPLPDAPLPLHVELTLPCSGATSVLSQVNAVTHGGRYEGEVGSVYIGLDITGSGDYADELATVRDAWVARMRDSQAQANAIIAAEHASLREAVESVVGVRHDRRVALVRAAADAMIPLAPVAQSSIPVPLTPTRITLESANDVVANTGDEAALAERIADDLVDMIRAFARSLERSTSTANRLLGEDEESIRDVLLFILNANWQGTITGETFLGRGKTDILLRWKDRDAFIGECKFWKGEQALNDGLTQLLERYTVWRATRVALILFIREISNVTAVISKARAVVSSHPRFVDSLAEDEFRLRAQHDAAQIVTLSLIPVILPTP